MTDRERERGRWKDREGKKVSMQESICQKLNLNKKIKIKDDINIISEQ